MPTDQELSDEIMRLWGMKINTANMSAALRLPEAVVEKWLHRALEKRRIDREKRIHEEYQE
jgi:hypothetical protein